MAWLCRCWKTKDKGETAETHRNDKVTTAISDQSASDRAAAVDKNGAVCDKEALRTAAVLVTPLGRTLFILHYFSYFKTLSWWCGVAKTSCI